MHISRINLRHIDFSDDTYSLLPPYCAEEIPLPLVASIKRCGILHAPIVKEKSASSFAIVAGRKRLRTALEHCAAVTCDCIKLTEKTTETEALGICLEEALLGNPLSPIQRATFFLKALQWMDEKDLAARYLPIMNLSPSVYLVQRDLKLLELEEPLVVAVHEEILEEKVAFELTKLSFSDRMALFEMINTLRLSVGNQKKMVITCRELAARKNTTISELLRSTQASAIINHPEANVPQKTANLMKWLSTERFPRFSEAEKKFHQFVAGLSLPPEARLEHSLSFEKNELMFTLPCVDHIQFTKIWERIKDLFPAETTKESHS
ncbi:MAG: ParB N-terminal domain-containing protein [Pseudomonadota bacterium]